MLMGADSEESRGGDPGEGIEGQSPRSRRGWRLPTRPGVPTGSVVSTERSGDKGGGGPGSDRPPSEATLSLRGGVFGQVTDVSEGTDPQSSQPVVTVRLERYDPHVGRTGIFVVRLRGGDALGFAEAGDWVEAAGKRRSAYIDASRCVNHTTGAQYRSRGTGTWLVLLAFLIVFLLVMIGIIVLLSNHFDNQANHVLRSHSGRVIELCGQGRPPRSLCEYSA